MRSEHRVRRPPRDEEKEEEKVGDNGGASLTTKASKLLPYQLCASASRAVLNDVLAAKQQRLKLCRTQGTEKVEGPEVQVVDGCS